MMKDKYTVKVNWVEAPYEVKPIRLEETITLNSRNTKLIFTCDHNRYAYVWSSSPMQGLGWLYKGNEGDEVAVYDPYKKRAQDTDMFEVARLLYLEIKKG